MTIHSWMPDADTTQVYEGVRLHDVYRLKMTGTQRVYDETFMLGAASSSAWSGPKGRGVV